MYPVSIPFDWDPEKAVLNLKKHGITFEKATRVFYDPETLRFFDDAHSRQEQRMVAIGRSGLDILTVAYVIYGSFSIHRIISARRASKQEWEEYYEEKRDY